MSNLNEAIRALQRKEEIKQIKILKESIKAKVPPGRLSSDPASIYESLSSQIKTERKNQKLTQRELAHLANCSQCTVVRAEKGPYTSLDTFIRLVAALGKTLLLN